ncbi:bifunctional 2-keto-4-hydroxyglutarate aldolase/2-keto-3-deoxy-6-phosphogluconate aldolase [Weissella cibaria]|uniref:bifunctional 2-keto-4-hydroxyglutarate aldolase/2-keto-3-deoxy-6-phosphogluconate aldolase n=1 Tax=Weissella cibaria TaxID=137591 RepID=UPI000D0BD258|nr:bifunctional 2-keto-4-hydroxyglutarate aldolase/2-keto-3-deoxy-6-phosphogluconate aldolase [Weissella cibaria]AVO66435.1 bifunctional 2-keto-4-hydroxyglutarate aldolase/2-keto-3-deoxy-6-phosphogluconate aldolase [Weissella cibaria]NKN31491.1 bifunctional 2-keto-4-hydroxyglutarate aldolase/2-keto-3-deoxy-6-phosphogluconate aldolase [Weissella cibaria]NKN80370.1 bifunctional 2-keto-4-hydroxyglutarate aldolase/2-keto-3-deoxy-6-phosphogluconate aldolase [Weissella cibaria]NKN97576.1 bifunctional
MKRLNILNKLQQAGVIAVVRAESVEKAELIVDALVDGGIKGIELTFTVPQADVCIKNLVDKYRGTDVIVVCGTVLDAVTARLAILAGAEFVVSPFFDVETAKMANLYQIPYMAGAMSITEMKAALEYGVDIVKLFPGSEASPSMVKAVKAPLPQVNIMPTGGVNLDNMGDWIAAGVVAVGVGGSLLKPAEFDDYAGVTDNARAYVERYQQLTAAKELMGV